MNWDEATKRRKLHLVRAMIFVSVFMFDTGELQYCDEVIENFCYSVNREFDLL